MSEEERSTKARVEDLLHTVRSLADLAYESFTQGEITLAQPHEFFGVVSNWATASAQVFETMNKLGRRT